LDSSSLANLKIPNWKIEYEAHECGSERNTVIPAATSENYRKPIFWDNFVEDKIMDRLSFKKTFNAIDE